MALPPLKYYRLDQAVNLINNNLDENLTIRDLVEYAHQGIIRIAMPIAIGQDKLVIPKSAVRRDSRFTVNKRSTVVFHSSECIEKFRVEHPEKMSYWDASIIQDDYFYIRFDTPRVSKIGDDPLIQLEKKEDGGKVKRVVISRKDKSQISKNHSVFSRNTKHSNYEKETYSMFGKIYFKGYVYANSDITNHLRKMVENNITVDTFGLGWSVKWESVVFPDSKVEALFFIKFDYSSVPVERMDEENSVILDINDFIIYKDQIDKFISVAKSSDTTPPNDLNLDNALYLIGEMLKVIKSSNARKWSQSSITNEILIKREGKTVKGLEERKIQAYFSKANDIVKNNPTN
ncbi:hypothetical protein [Otariodibacter sp.]|uniref:hypothetical protein n=1 Tax=Otariodibacter sp. TaxID=3030919 RepID=UPI0026226DA5|nr:hypothetical protein [Otariodibacter sp.]